MNNINIDRLFESCRLLEQKTIYKEGYMHVRHRCFDACMRAFSGQPSAESITFRVFFNAPIMKEGFATIHRNGDMELYTKEAEV